MPDRQLQIIIPIKSSQVELARTLVASVGEFPTVAWNCAVLMAEIFEKDTLTKDDGEKLGKLLLALKADAELAEQRKRGVEDLFKGAFFHDPDGRKEPLQ